MQEESSESLGKTFHLFGRAAGNSSTWRSLAREIETGCSLPLNGTVSCCFLAAYCLCSLPPEGRHRIGNLPAPDRASWP